jgi:hypothetical protein
MAENPFAGLESFRVVEQRHSRRELQAEELTRLLQAARDSARRLFTFTGNDRYHLYAVACATGFRASALACLTPAHFDLGDMPTVTLPARRDISSTWPVRSANCLLSFLSQRNPTCRRWQRPAQMALALTHRLHTNPTATEGNRGKQIHQRANAHQ